MGDDRLLSKRKGRYQAQKTVPPHRGRWLLSALLLLAVVAGCCLLCQKEPAGALPEETVEKLDGAAAIPGFESLTLQAGTKKQTLVLSNPEENTCLFRLSLILEDGTVLWTSKYISPGCDSDPVKLTQPLAAGSYPNTTLKYECFTTDKTPLNGAEIILTLRVKES